MLKFFLKNGKKLAIGVTAVFSIILLISAIVMLSRYKNVIAETASEKAQYYSLGSRTRVERVLSDKSAKAIAVAHAVSDLSSEEDVAEYLYLIDQKEGFNDIAFARYFKGDVLYTASGEALPTDYVDSSKAFRSATPDVSGYVGCFRDVKVTGGDGSSYTGTESVFGFYAPVTGSNSVDAVVIYYTRDKMGSFFSGLVGHEDAEISVLCSTEGILIT
ncbi:MAG: hypothetical protein MJ072_02685, partial [Clostridia bacterium]|nr:hypothetical protein [Clostridia bacterium]